MIDPDIFVNIWVWYLYIYVCVRFLCVPPQRIGPPEQTKNKGNPIHLLRSSIFDTTK